MKQIDLDPKEYRVLGVKRLRRHLSHRALSNLIVVAGIWAAMAIWIGRHFFVEKDLIPVITVTFAPALAIIVYATITEPRRD